MDVAFGDAVTPCPGESGGDGGQVILGFQEQSPENVRLGEA
jgi:hypothetical protein